jgi:hypothetical protein
MAEESTDSRPPAEGAVRQADIEPYTALVWVSRLFKGAAIFLLVAITGELIAGLRVDGMAALPIILGELIRTMALIVVLWGAGDLVRLLMHVGNDIRAQRILLVRIAARIPPVGDGEAEEQDARAEAARASRQPETRREPRIARDTGNGPGLRA